MIINTNQAFTIFEGFDNEIQWDRFVKSLFSITISFGLAFIRKAKKSAFIFDRTSYFDLIYPRELGGKHPAKPSTGQLIVINQNPKVDGICGLLVVPNHQFSVIPRLVIGKVLIQQLDWLVNVKAKHSRRPFRR